MKEQDNRYTNIDDEVKDIVENTAMPNDEIPQAVKDVDAYSKYIKLKNTPTLQRENRMIDTSDEGLTVDPMWLPHKISKMIVHLPSDEQDRIMRRVKAIKLIHLKIGALKLKAFGLKRPRYHKSLQKGLLDERQAELLEYFGRMLSAKEVHKIITLDWGYDVALETVRSFRKQHADTIDQMIINYKKDFSDIRLSQKKGRLEELVQLYHKRKALHDVSQSKSDHQLLLQTLRAIKDECEDKTLRITADINANVMVTINNHIQEEVMKGLTINDIIIARTAARMQVNPRFLISRLHNSYYAKHSGFLMPSGSLQDEELQYPSSIVYNWNAIEAQHAATGDTGLQLAEYEEVPTEKKDVGATLKEILKKRLGEKKDDLSEAEQRIKKHTK